MRDLRAFALSMSQSPLPGMPAGPPPRARRPARARRDRPRSEMTAEELASARARQRAYWKGACSRCGKPMHVSPGRTLAPDRRKCQECRRADPQRAQPEPRICVLCAESYVRKSKGRPDQRWCSKSCAQAWRNGARPPYTRVADGDDGMARKIARNRLRLRVHAETWDGVTDEQIMERDRWRCGICGKRIGKSYKYPHPRSKSIDHLIPISQGGDDKAPNKRAAHLACNCGRMNRGGGEQLAMIG